MLLQITTTDWLTYTDWLRSMKRYGMHAMHNAAPSHIVRKDEF